MNGGAPMNLQFLKNIFNMFKDQNVKAYGYDLPEREKGILSHLVEGLSIFLLTKCFSIIDINL
jgi:hypothetical protein